MLFKSIVSPANLESAYGEIVAKFDKKSRSSSYVGIDGVSLSDLDSNSKKVLKEIRRELLDFQPLLPAKEYRIPKKNGGTRIIYVYSLRDRIKGQAISRVLEQFFEKIYSPFLYSYRSSHPAHFAAKSVIRRYMRSYGEDYIFRGDITNYTEEINQDILRKKLSGLNFEEEAMKLLELLIGSRVFSKNKIFQPEKGIIQGTPVIALFANFYLNDLDHSIGKKVALYRRVGDDIIICDKNPEKISAAKAEILKEVRSLDLRMQEKKTICIKNTGPFSFLGYDFMDKKVRIQKSSVDRFINHLKSKLAYYPLPELKKKRRLEALLYKSPKCIHNQFVQFLGSYQFSNDAEQIMKISEILSRVITRYFFKTYSPRNHELTRKLTASIKIPSIYQYYLAIHNGKVSYAELALSKKKPY